QHLALAEERLAECPQPLGVGIECLRALIDLQVAEHVKEDEEDENRPRHRHGDLLADRRSPERLFASHPCSRVVPARRAQPSAAIVSRTAAADFSSAAFSPAVSSTSTICSIPLRPSLTGTPRNSPSIPYSPCSQAAHGRMRFLSLTIASAICTAAAAGASYALPVFSSPTISAPPVRARSTSASIRSCGSSCERGIPLTVV